MSFWGNLAKIGGYVSAPFTGGASIPIGQAVGGGIDSFSKGAGAASQAQASNRGTKAELMLDQNSDLERQLLAREQEKRSARNDAFKNAMMGGNIANYKPVQGPPGINVVRFGGGGADGTGGAISNPNAVGAANVLAAQGMNRLGQPDLNVDGGGSMPSYRNLWNDPEFKKTLNPGLMEKIMGWSSAFSPLLGTLLNRQDGGAPQSGNSAQYGYNPQSSVTGGPNQRYRG